MTEISGGYLARFIRATALLALPAESQRLWLSSLGLPGEPGYADEMATEFDDGLLLLPQFVAAGWLSHEAADRLTAVDALLEKMSGPEKASLWSIEALYARAEWEAVRAAARDALFAV